MFALRYRNNFDIPVLLLYLLLDIIQLYRLKLIHSLLLLAKYHFEKIKY